MFTTYLKYILHELEIRHTQRIQLETVLVMQGGGSLGAYECGVYKTLSKHGIKFDIVAGTSIGAVNAAIERSEDIHFIFEDADFSANTIRKLIRQGERDAETAITQRRDKTTK